MINARLFGFYAGSNDEFRQDGEDTNLVGWLNLDRARLWVKAHYGVAVGLLRNTRQLLFYRPLRRAKVLYRLARRSLRKMRRRVHLRVALFLYVSWQKLVSLGRRILGQIVTFVATLIGIVMAVLFAIYVPDAFLEGPRVMVSGVHLASSGIIGTALALVLTLSIVPAQKAADVFSSGVLRLYQRDSQLFVVFVTLSFLALISVLFGTNWTFGINARYTLAAQFVVLGAAFDMVRHFYARALELLDPTTALKLIERECNRDIRVTKREIERLADIHRLSGEKLGGESDVIPKWLLHLRSPVPDSLSGWTDQLEGFAHKAVARHDTQAAIAVTKTMASIGMKYADSRRDSLVLRPDFASPMLMMTSDIENVLNPIYESLKKICEGAARLPNEAVVMSCLRSFGDMAVHAMTIIHGQEGERKTAPLAYSPVFYIDHCTKTAINAGMDDALLASINQIGQVLGYISVEVDTLEVESTSLDCLFHIAITSYARQATVPCLKAVEMMLRVARLELQRRGFRRVSILDKVLRKLTELVSFEALMDNSGQRRMQTFPPYNMAFEANIPLLLAEVANQVRSVDPNQSWVDPFHDFEEASEMIVHHYREVGEKVSFEGALLEKWIMDSIFASAEIHINLLENPPQGSEPYLDTVGRRLAWFISAPSLFFRETIAFPKHHAKEASERIAILGMNLLKLQRPELAKDCGKTIAIIGNRSAAAKEKSRYGTADILIKLEELARAADALGYDMLAAEFRVSANPETVSEEALPGYAEAIQTRIGQLDKKLSERNRKSPFPYDSVRVLRQMIRENPFPPTAQ